jgi:hypothetical protein
MKKLLYVAVLVALVCGCSFLIGFNAPIKAYVGDYEIITDLNFLLLASFASLLLIFNLIGGYYIIRSTNKNKFLNKNKKIQEIYEKYINIITKGLLSDLNGNLKGAEKNRKQAEKILKNHDLTKVLESQILLNKQKYEQATAVVKTIKVDNSYLIDNISLTQALRKQDTQNIELCCKKILEYRKGDETAITNLYKAYKSSLDWFECKKLLKMIKKYKIFDRTNLEIENQIVENNLKQQVNAELS